MTRILLADDQRLVAESVSAALSSTEGYAVDLSDSLASTLQTLKREAPYEAVLLDLHMPDMDGITSVKKVVDCAENASVVLFTANAEYHAVMRAIEVGVRGLIPKTLPLQSLGSVLRLIQSGQIYIPADLRTLSQPADGAVLTEGELVVLQMAASGLTNKHIAHSICESESKIKMHMRIICRKLDARNRAHAAMIGQDMGIVDLQASRFKLHDIDIVAF